MGQSTIRVDVTFTLHINKIVVKAHARSQFIPQMFPLKGCYHSNKGFLLLTSWSMPLLYGRHII